MLAAAKVTDYPAPTPRRKWVRLLLIVLLAVVTATGCSRKDRDMRSGAEELFERGTKSMRSRNFSNAINYYEALEARYPFSNQAKQAQLNLIYCYYRNGARELAVDAATQFERENPTHPRVDYALYMRGIANFAPEHNMFHRMFRVKLWKRPPVNARESFSAFSRLVQRYPQSRYAPDAHQRMVFLRNRMADHENYIAEYYYKRGAFVAAANRAKYVIESFEGAPAVADSLYIIMKSYEKLGMQDLAMDTRRVLEENYPDAVQPKATKKRFFFF